MKTVTASDSKLMDREVREYIRYAKLRIQENYFEYADAVFDPFVQELGLNQDLTIHLAEIIYDLFEQQGRDVSLFPSAAAKSICICLENRQMH